ncbi:MAG: type IV pili twitching motility protein PilT, partial [Lentisphaeria bacterium]|nr:type IV pili twitching motility protein PilT [Lentisphaeria bacterium]
MAALDVYLEYMMQIKASDLHMSSNLPVAYRVDGEIVFTETEPMQSDYIHQLAFEIMSERHRKQFTDCNDSDLAYALPSGDRFRVNVFRDLNGVGIVARLIPADILTFEQLNLP